MRFDEQYERYLALAGQALQAQADAIFQDGSRVSEAARYSLFSGGKRVRAVLCLAVCDMLDGETPRAAAYAAGVEMLHCYSLIHDDLPCMDDDDTRRGKPSCHKAFGEDTALLAGDALQTAAFEAVAGAAGGGARNADAAVCLAGAAGARGMVYGQELDLYYETTRANESQLEQIHRHKTGALINAAVQMGAIAAGASGEQRRQLEEYAYGLGLVFQIVDDILDVTSTSEALGKPVGSDAHNGKSTFVSLYGVERAQQLAQQVNARACGALEPFGEKAAFLRSLADKLLVRRQ